MYSRIIELVTVIQEVTEKIEGASNKVKGATLTEQQALLFWHKGQIDKLNEAKRELRTLTNR